MRPERWEEIKRIFNEVVELPAARRGVFLDSECADEAVRVEVERMLAADSSTALEQSPLSLLAPDSYARLAGKRLGRYRILREVGRGGMGAVFAAVRDDGEFDQKVAVKVINGGFNTDTILRHFRRERQILASLEHPNIARLLDGGMSEEGLPFYVMEFVEGEPLDEYCRARGLGVAERLVLFRQVCAAVSYAHARLIVHRDLKPSNVLVTGDGQAKLLDFGIAKILSRGETGAHGTATQLGLMTPDYASPEQFRGETATTSTDVYSLGVVLYALLAGAPPYDLTGLRLDQMLERVCQTEPPPPSRAATGAARLGGEAGEPPAVRPPQLKGDLDNIVLKALRKEPEHRYGSVEQLSEDIGRHLSGLPVLARPATFGYKAGKFVRRNRPAVALSVMVLLALAGGVAATVSQAVRAERERGLAQKRFEQSREMANSLVFKYHDAIAGLPNSSPVREMLLKDASAYLDNLAQDAGGDLTLLREVALAYAKLGDIQGRPHEMSVGNTAAAIENYEKAAALYETIARDAPKADRPRAYQDLLAIHRKVVVALARAKENEPRRRELQERRLSIIEGLLKERPDDFGLKMEAANAHTVNGNRLFRADFDAGYRYYEEKILPVLAEAERSAPDDPKTAGLGVGVYSALGWYCSEQGRLTLDLGEGREKAAEYFQRALEFYRRVAAINEKEFRLSPDDPSSRRGHIIGVVNVGIALRDVGRVEEALEHLDRGREMYRELERFDPNNLQAVFDLGDLYTATALCHLKRGDRARAVADLEESLAHMERVVAADGKHHEAINYKVEVLTLLGNAHAEAGARQTALGYYERAESFAVKTLTGEPSDRTQLGRIHLNAGRAYAGFAEAETSAAVARQLWAKAQAELRKAAEIIETGRDPEAPKHLRVIRNQLSRCERALG